MVEVHRALAAAPRVQQRRYATDYYGDHREDPYHWLRDPSYPELLDRDILDHIRAENAYALATISAPLRASLEAELQERLVARDDSVPHRDRGYWYWSHFEPAAQYPELRRAAHDPSDVPDAATLQRRSQVYLDLTRVAEGYPYSHVAKIAFHPDEDLFCYSHDSRGDERYRVRFARASHARRYAFTIDECDGFPCWSNDGSWVFYLELDEANRPRRLCRRQFSEHQLGARVVVYEEPDPSFWMHLSQTDDRLFLLLWIGDKETNEVLLIDSNAPQAPAAVFFPRVECHRYRIQHGAQGFFVLSNWHHQNFELFHLLERPEVEVDFADPSEVLATYLSDATRVLPGSEALLSELQIFERAWVVLETHEANTRIRIGRVGATATEVVAVEEAAYSFMLDRNDDPASAWLRVVYQSLRHPPQVMEIDLRAPQRRRVLKVESPSAPYDPDDYVSERIWAASHDGTMVPVSLIRRASTPLSGNAPLYLYAYGSYGLTIAPKFHAHRLSLLERGFVYAIAHVRGGSALGRGWYLDGKLQNKPNTFQDLIFCASQLIEFGYTSPGRIVVAGASAGGLLVGNVINQAPELFAAAVAHVPFVDCLNTMLDASLPLTPNEYTEWGDPLASERAYWRIKGFAPYENVRPQSYPTVFVTNSVHDPRVTYWEALKWVARLRELALNDPWVVVHTNHAAGHGGVSGRYRAIGEIALEYAFVLQSLEMIGATNQDHGTQSAGDTSS